MIESFAHKEARRLARKLLSEAEENEPRIIAALQKIALETSAEMVGLENKFKSEQSLIKKLLLLADRDKSDQTIFQKLEKFARRNNDALRYTFIFPNDKYVEGFALTIEKLEQSGFAVPPNRIWNAWKKAGTAKDTGYRGINITVISSQARIFELQFHTAESFRLKMETHDLYKELRDLKTSDERRLKIIREVTEKARQINQPKAI